MKSSYRDLASNCIFYFATADGKESAITCEEGQIILPWSSKMVFRQ